MNDQYGWYGRSARSFHRTTRSNLAHCIHQPMCSPESAEFHHGGSCRTQYPQTRSRVHGVHPHITPVSPGYTRIIVHRVDRYHTNRITATGTVSVPTLQLLCHIEHVSKLRSLLHAFFGQSKMDALGNVATGPGVQIITPMVHRSVFRVPSVHGW